LADGMSNIAEVIRHFPGDLQDPMLQFWEVMKDEIGVKRKIKKCHFSISWGKLNTIKTALILIWLG